jgi:branched-chain amino acid transport system permease protein
MWILLPQVIIDGLLLGGIYFSLAVGFSTAYGVLHIIDFAVGEWIMLGGFVGLTLSGWIGVDPFVTLPLLFVVFFGAGFYLEPVLARAMSGSRGRPVLMGLVFTFGLALFFAGSGQTVFGILTKSVNTFISQGSWSFALGPFYITIPYVRFACLLYAALMMIGLTLLLKKTDFGLAVRAVALNKEAAGLMGVNVGKTAAWVYGIFTSVTAMTGVFYGAALSLNTHMGPKLTVLAFFVVVLAGMGHLPGVPWAAILLGLIHSFFVIYLQPAYTLLAVFGILYIILLISPTGMFRKGI